MAQPLHSTDLQTSPSIDLTEDQDTPRYQLCSQAGSWEHRVFLRETVIVLLLDNNNWSKYLHLTVNIGSDGIEMTINVKIF